MPGMVSLKRIAAELDVSYSLVSKVLNGRLGTTGVSEATRDAIQKKAKELNYVPNRLAVALKAGRRGVVGIFFHHMGIPGSDVSDRLLKGLVDGLEQGSSRMWLRYFTTDSEFLDACDARLQSEVDGLIVAGVYHSGLNERLRELERLGVPVVTMFNDEPSPAADNPVTRVQVSYFSHGYAPTRHLLDSGCRRLACLDTIESRTKGFLQAHKDAKVRVDRSLVIPSKKFLKEDGRKAAKALLAAGLPVDGIVCQSDAQANGVICELILKGVKVPEQVKVTGVDNSPLAEECIVPITSMTSEVRKAGLKSVELLFQRIEGRKVKSIMIEPRLVARNSTGEAPAKTLSRAELE